MFKYAIIISLFFCISACDKRLPADEANNALAESSRYLAAGKMAEAEKTLQEAILKNDSFVLKEALLELYINNNRWNDAETYLRGNEKGLADYVLKKSYWKLSSKYFNEAKWIEAAHYSMKAASLMREMGKTGRAEMGCEMSMPETLRNAAAAYYNSMNLRAISEILQQLYDIQHDSACQYPEITVEIEKSIRDVLAMKNRLSSNVIDPAL